MSQSRFSQARQFEQDYVKNVELRTSVAISYEKQAPSEAADFAGALGAALSSGGSLMGGNNQTNYKAKRGLAEFRGWVYVAVNAIAKAIAAQPAVVGRFITEQQSASKHGTLSVTKHRLQTHAGPYQVAQAIAAKAATSSQKIEVIDAHPLVDLLAKPNPVQRKWELLYFATSNLLLTGQCYFIGGMAYDEETGAQRPELWAVPSSWVRPIHDKGLFAEYAITFKQNEEPTIYPAENVTRICFPHPSDPRECMSPLEAITSAVSVDNAIQSSQEQMFSRGIHPNLIVTVGKVVGPDGSTSDRRPVLTSAQRRSITRAIREVWRNTVGQGDPAILDGFIENVHKLSNSPNEMDWLNSGKITKDRIFQAFSVNPIVVGEITPANKAQAVEADKNFCAMAVNPIIDSISNALTELAQYWFPGGTDGNTETPQDALAVWIEPRVPIDSDLKLREWETARKNEDVTRNEFRTEILGLPPMEDRVEKPKLMQTVGGITGTVQVLSAVGQGVIRPAQAAKVFELFFDLDADTAGQLAGVGGNIPGAAFPNVQPLALPAPDEEQPTPEEQAQQEQVASYAGAKIHERLWSSELRKEYNRNDVGMTIDHVKQSHVAQHGRIEGVLGDQLADYFREYTKRRNQ